MITSKDIKVSDYSSVFETFNETELRVEVPSEVLTLEFERGIHPLTLRIENPVPKSRESHSRISRKYFSRNCVWLTEDPPPTGRFTKGT